MYIGANALTKIKQHVQAAAIELDVESQFLEIRQSVCEKHDKLFDLVKYSCNNAKEGINTAS